MAAPAPSSFNLRSILEKEKLIVTNFMDWYHNLRIVLRQEHKEFVLTEPFPADLPNNALVAQHREHEKLAEGNPVSLHVIKMIGYTESLDKLGFPLSRELATDLILQSLPPSFEPFIMNFNMNNMNKTLAELHGMLKTAEESIKKNSNHVMVMHKRNPNNKKSGQKRKLYSDEITSTSNSKTKVQKTGPAKDAECFFCKETVYWKRNCKKYLEQLKQKQQYRNSSTSVDKTPYEIWTGKHPSLSFLKIWGCEVYVKRLQSDKLTTKSDKCFFVGYPKETKGYYFYNRKEGKVFVARHSVFLEKEFISRKDSGSMLWKHRLHEGPKGYGVHLQVWNLVDSPDDVKAIECKWVFKKKIDVDGNVHIYKARLVAKGFRQIQGVDYDETFSPVAILKSIRIVLAIAAYFDYEIWQMDVKTAFLNGNLDEDVYTTQPKGFVDPQSAKKICKLQKSIYGFKQASRSWNIRFDEDLGKAAYILGIRIYRDRSKRLIGLSQSTYIDKMFHMHLVQQADTNQIQVSHWIAVKNILKYLRRTKDMFLVYGGQEELVVNGYTDASFQTDKDDFRSQSGFVFCLNGGAVSWKSSKQNTVADSTTEAEYIAASEAAKEVVWIKKFVSQLGVMTSTSRPMDLYCDNSGAIAQAKEPRSHQKSKHILRRYHLIREIVGRGDVKICKIHTDLNVADPLTKPLPQPKHEAHTRAMGIRYVHD
uniref:OSJNBa0023J03.14 protein n=2 Tax=Oryza sativa TaxID=4530 RepID=Q7X7F2_ORYSJ|nr:OSJNBa0023J03.14 [Oryza sativa Japonica Group]CAE02400.1 OSJNBa0024J22.4 [Oryza sativa Japonica Group]CAH66059.1 OSIGBa0125J07.8 [Oryza sativa]CAH66155.1 OSIGBa0113B06.1 [Oryza sativa]